MYILLGTLCNAFCGYNDSKMNNMYNDVEREKRSKEDWIYLAAGSVSKN